MVESSMNMQPQQPVNRLLIQDTKIQENYIDTPFPTKGTTTFVPSASTIPPAPVQPSLLQSSSSAQPEFNAMTATTSAVIPPAPAMPSVAPVMASTSAPLTAPIPPAPAALPMDQQLASQPPMNRRERRNRFRELKNSLTQQANNQAKSTMMKTAWKFAAPVKDKVVQVASSQVTNVSETAKLKVHDTTEGWKFKVKQWNQQRKANKLAKRQEMLEKVDNVSTGIYVTKKGEEIPVRLTKKGKIPASEKMRVAVMDKTVELKEEAKALGLIEHGRAILHNLKEDIKDAIAEIGSGLKEDLKEASKDISHRAKWRYVEVKSGIPPTASSSNEMMMGMERTLGEQQRLLRRERKKEKRRQKRLEKKMRELQLVSMEQQQQQMGMSTLANASTAPLVAPVVAPMASNAMAPNVMMDNSTLQSQPTLVTSDTLMNKPQLLPQQDFATVHQQFNPATSERL